VTHQRRYRVVFTTIARDALRHIDGAERLQGIPPSVLTRETLRPLLANTALGQLLDDLDEIASAPYGGQSIARTGAEEDDRVLLSGSLAVTYMVSSAVEPPIITITNLIPPKSS
jgi:hypothetical protein